MAERETQAQGLATWVMLGVMAWAVIAALGVARYDHKRGQFNVVKPIVTIAVTLVIIGGWRAALVRRRRRAESRNQQN